MQRAPLERAPLKISSRRGVWSEEASDLSGREAEVASQREGE